MSLDLPTLELQNLNLDEVTASPLAIRVAVFITLGACLFILVWITVFGAHPSIAATLITTVGSLAGAILSVFVVSHAWQNTKTSGHAAAVISANNAQQANVAMAAIPTAPALVPTGPSMTPVALSATAPVQVAVPAPAPAPTSIPVSTVPVTTVAAPTAA